MQKLNPRTEYCAGILYSLTIGKKDDLSFFSGDIKELSNNRSDTPEKIKATLLYAGLTDTSKSQGRALRDFHEKTGNKYHYIPIYEGNEGYLSLKGDNWQYVYIVPITELKTKARAFQVIKEELEEYNYYLNK